MKPTIDLFLESLEQYLGKDAGTLVSITATNPTRVPAIKEFILKVYRKEKDFQEEITKVSQYSNIEDRERVLEDLTKQAIQNTLKYCKMLKI